MVGANRSSADYNEADENKPKFCRRMSLEDSIKEKIHSKDVRKRIPRQNGHYKLCDRHHPGDDTHKDKFQQPIKHYDVSGAQNYERSTRRLTISAVNHAVEKERIKRMGKQDEEWEMARKYLGSLNKEFHRTINLNKQRHKKNVTQNIARTEERKSLVLEELGHFMGKKVATTLVEMERKRRLEELEAMIDDSQACEKDFGGLIKDVAINNQKMDLVREEMLQAMDLREEGLKAVEEEDYNYMCDLKDQVMNEFRYKIIVKPDLDKQIETEQKRLSISSPDIVPNYTQYETQERMGCAMGEMMKLFSNIKIIEVQVEMSSKNDTKRRLSLCQEELVKKVVAKGVDKECSKERSRRIHDLEEGVTIDEKQKNVIDRVHRELILSVFHGHKVTPRVQVTNVNESEHDRQLRRQREGMRRRSLFTSA